MTAPVGRRRTSDSATRYLRSLIYSGRLASGDRLPPERELARQLDISTLTLRTALRSLETARFLTVTIGSRGGWWVSDTAVLTRCWTDWARDHRREIDQMLEFLRMVDVGTAAFAAERRTREDLDALEQIISGWKQERGSLAHWHTEFHDALTRAAHNQYLEWAGTAIRGELFLPVEHAVSEERIAETERVHDAVLAAVRERDPDCAAAEMRAHLAYTRRLFETTMSAHLTSEGVPSGTASPSTPVA